MARSSIREHDLLVLVGLTGVGKTSTVKALADAGLRFRLLPNRRELTDEHMIGWLQDEAGEARRHVADRSQRFDLTRQYRERFFGGMAHVLAGLQLERGSEPWVLFDGLRGEHEVAAAAAALPRARFLVLTAPPGVRLLRLLGRGDAFDQMATPGSAHGAAPASSSLNTRVDFVEGSALIDPATKCELGRLLDSGELEAEEVQAKLAILEKEQENYAEEEALQALRRSARDRLIEAATEVESSTEIAVRVAALLAGPEADCSPSSSADATA